MRRGDRRIRVLKGIEAASIHDLKYPGNVGCCLHLPYHGVHRLVAVHRGCWSTATFVTRGMSSLSNSKRLGPSSGARKVFPVVGNDPISNRISHIRADNWNGAGRLLGGERRRRARGENHINARD